MRSEQRLRKNLKWYKREIETPFIASLIASIIMWAIIGALLECYEHRQDLSQLTFAQVLPEMRNYGVGGIFFAIVMRVFSLFHVRQIEKELGENS